MKIDDIKKLCEEQGYELIEYLDQGKVVIKDKEGYMYNTSVTSMKARNGHNILQKNRFALHNIKLYAEKHSDGVFHVLSDEYKGCKSKLVCKCDKHPDKLLLKTAEQIMNTKTVCDYCYSEIRGIKYRAEETQVKKYVEEHNGTFDHIEFKNGETVVYYYCNRHRSEGLLETRWTVLGRRKHICRKCSGRDLTTIEYKNRVAELHPDIEVLGEYERYERKMPFRCKTCGFEWEATAGQLMSKRKRGCPNCAYERRKAVRRKSLDAFISELSLVNDNIEVIGQYVNTHTLIKCRCKIHDHVFETMPCNLLNMTSTCPVCAKSMSKMERRVGQVLDDHNIAYINHHHFDDCIGAKLRLEFDYYLPDYNIVIEYDGRQHFMPVDYFGGEEKFAIQQQYDRTKDEYCRDNGIGMIRIPYYEDNNFEQFLNTQLNQFNICT